MSGIKNLFQYNLSLAWKSLWRTPVLAVLLIIALAIASSTLYACLIIYFDITHNPLSKKNDDLYTLQLEIWRDSSTTEYRPRQLTYKDAIEIARAKIPKYSALMYKTGGNFRAKNNKLGTVAYNVRATERDFFNLFEPPFMYGAPWTEEEGRLGESVIVISYTVNKRFFAGTNSVGKYLELSNRSYRIIGVLDRWYLTPKIYDLNEGVYGFRDDVFMPFRSAINAEYHSWGKTEVRPNYKIEADFDIKLKGENAWLQFWFEIESENELVELSKHIEKYLLSQKQLGRVYDPKGYRFYHPDQWLSQNKIMGVDMYILLLLSICFIVAVMTNMALLLSAKYLRYGDEVSIRRALGASRKLLFLQHMAEISMISFFAGLVGIILFYTSIINIQTFYPDYIQNKSTAELWLEINLLTLAIGVGGGLWPAVRYRDLVLRGKLGVGK